LPHSCCSALGALPDRHGFSPELVWAPGVAKTPRRARARATARRTNSKRHKPHADCARCGLVSPPLLRQKPPVVGRTQPKSWAVATPPDLTTQRARTRARKTNSSKAVACEVGGARWLAPASLPVRREVVWR